jgi:uncharacterized membrane protein YgaE (UPF0421/DUF939 family)
LVVVAAIIGYGVFAPWGKPFAVVYWTAALVAIGVLLRMIWKRERVE